MNTSRNKNTLKRREFIRTSIFASSIACSPFLITACNSVQEDISPGSTMKSDFIPVGEFGFLEGVASFDPGQNNVILWTRYSPAQNEVGKPQILIEVANDENFTHLVVNESLFAEVDANFCIQIDLQNLKSNTRYFYRFRNEKTGTISPTGVTKTLPSEGEAEEIKIAIVSCANFELGYFNVYEAIANTDVDIIIHLGDYIYEGYRKNHLSEREHLPSNELYSLEDYRTRYTQYRRDLQLQKVHQLKPFICIWDDHEFTNNTYKFGASGHQDNEGDFLERIKNARQAWHEFLPCRVNNLSLIYRSFNIGGILKLLMLDTRLIGRDKQLDYTSYFDNGTIKEEFYNDWQNPNRTLLGKDQKNWLINEIQSSTCHWQVLGNQVLMGKHYLPAELIPLMQENSNLTSLNNDEISEYYKLIAELIEIKSKIDSNDPSLTTEEKSRFENLLPYNLDSWDGYPMEREQIFQNISNKKVISFAGASHNAWHNNLISKNGTKVGAEFATPSITSEGLEGLFGNNPIINSGLEQANTLLMDNVNYSKIAKRGFIKATFTKSTARAEWNFVDTILASNPNFSTDHTVEES